MKFTKIFRIVGALTVLILLVLRIDHGDVLDRLRAAHAGVLTLAFAVIVIDGLLRAWNWRQLLQAMKLSSDVPYGKVLACFWSAAFLGQVVPSTAGTDALRVLLATRAVGGPVSAHAAAIVMLNAISLFAGCVCGLALTLFLGFAVGDASGVRPAIALVFAGVVIGATCGYLLVKYQRGLVVRALRRLRGAKLRKLRHGLRRFIDRLLVFERRGAHALPVFAVACCTLLTRSVAFALAGAAVNLKLPLMAWITIVPSTMLSGLLPYSVAGYGGDQAASVYFLSGFGALPAHALAFALLVPLVPMFFNLLGGIPVLLGRVGPARTKREREVIDTAP